MKCNVKNRIKNRLTNEILTDEIETENFRMHFPHGVGEEIRNSKEYKKYLETGDELELIDLIASPDFLLKMIFQAGE